MLDCSCNHFANGNPTTKGNLRPVGVESNRIQMRDVNKQPTSIGSQVKVAQIPPCTTADLQYMTMALLCKAISSCGRSSWGGILLLGNTAK